MKYVNCFSLCCIWVICPLTKLCMRKRARGHAHTRTHTNSFTWIQIYLSKYLVFRNNISKQDWERGGETVVAKIKEFSIQNLIFLKLKIVPRGKTSATDNNALKSNIHSTIYIRTHINNLPKKKTYILIQIVDLYTLH